MSLFNRIKEFIRFNDGSTFSTIYNGNVSNKTLSDDVKLKFMLNNPALLKVVALNCDVFSLAEIKRVDGKEKDPLIDILKDPNYFQSQRQFLWNYRFWMMFGNAYLRPTTTRIDSDYRQLYWLEPTKMDFGKLENKLDQMISSQKNYNDILNATIKYTYNDGTKIEFKLKEIISFQDMTNGLGNWYVGNSRIDALWKILGNADSALDAKSINLEFARKFIISGNYDPSKDLNSTATMQDIEKEGIIQKLRSKQPIHPVKAQVDIKRFVDNIANLKLDESYNQDLAKVGSMYNIPEDILEALKKGSTYENQEKAIGRHINYSEMPKAKDLLEGLCGFYELDASDYEITFNNNSFMQVFEKDRAVVNMTNARTLDQLIKNGAEVNEAAEFLGIDLKFKKVTNGNEQETTVE